MISKERMVGETTSLPKAKGEVLESKLVRAIMQGLTLVQGCHPLRINSGTIIMSGRSFRGCEPGTPDILVMLPAAQVLWLECKTAKGRVSPVQLAWHAKAVKLGHAVHVVRATQEAIECVRDALRRSVMAASTAAAPPPSGPRRSGC